MTDMVNNPPHYGGKDNPYEVIKVLKEWKLLDSFFLANAIKYIARCRTKGNKKEDLAKAIYYIKEELKMEEINNQEEKPLTKEEKLQHLIYKTFYTRFKDATIRLAVWDQILLALKHNLTHSLYYIWPLRKDLDKSDPYFYDTLIREVDKILNEQDA